jgi:hypothetical protein
MIEFRSVFGVCLLSKDQRKEMQDKTRLSVQMLLAAVSPRNLKGIGGWLTNGTR